MSGRFCRVEQEPRSPRSEMRAVSKIILSLLIVMSAVWMGCGPSVDRDGLGEVIFEVPSVPGADEPYQLPEPPAEPAELPDPASDQ